MANLEVILDEKLADSANEKGKYYKQALIDHPKIKDIRQIGLMLGLDLQNNDDASKLVKLFVKNGLITDRFLFRPNAFRIAPPLIISQQEIDKSLDLIRKSLDQL